MSSPDSSLDGIYEAAQQILDTLMAPQIDNGDEARPMRAEVLDGLTQALRGFASQVDGAKINTINAAVDAVQRLRDMSNSGGSINEVDWRSAVEEASKISQKAAQMAQEKAGEGAEFARENPLYMATILAGGVLMAAPGIVTAPVLGIAGFGGQGVVGGSLAAGFQSTIGNVIGGSAFATLQSAGVGGYGLASVNAVVQGAGVATSSWGLGNWVKGKYGRGADDKSSQS